MKNEKYVFKNCPIPGGGYVTGFVFHENEPGVLYCRTDIGGTYRFERDTHRWASLIDHVTMEDLAETFPIALALDPHDADVLYIACGVNRVPHGKLAVSHDRGRHFDYFEMPMMIHGNLNGRGTGYRLIVDNNNPDRLLFASQLDGLFVSCDRGRSWSVNSAFAEKYMTFVGISNSGDILFAAGAGVTTARSERLRGHSLFVSKDNGASFAALPGPEDEEIDGVALAGHVAQRYTVDDKYLYVTYSVMGADAYVKELGYSCDGGSVIDGRIYRYEWEAIRHAQIDESGMLNYAGEDITPPVYLESSENKYGFSGICISKKQAGLLIASTICKGNGDCIYRSLDYGNTWECILFALKKGHMDFRAEYMKPEYNGGGNLIHWLTDVKINPHDENEAWFNTGTGVFVTHNLLADDVHFSDWSDGIEETVHLNVYSPPSGDVRLIDILGDLGGFAFRDLDKPCDNSFADEHGNRYITCINADYSDQNPTEVIVTPRGNWTGKTKGGLIVSHDGCRTFERLNLPYGLSDELDGAFRRIETPNVNSGWVALSPDAANIVWSVADGINLPSNRVIVSHDGGATFEFVKIYDRNGCTVDNSGFKAFSDRIKSDVFYGFGDHSDIYISTDSGASFREVPVCNITDGTEALSRCSNETDEVSSYSGGMSDKGRFTDAGEPFGGMVDFTLIDCANKTEVRANSGESGVFYMALADKGLWKLHIRKEECCAYKLSNSSDTFFRLGLGIASPDGDYFAKEKAIYTSAIIDGIYGFYRSVDEGKSFVRLNDDSHMFGEINSMDGDSRVFGRFYIATGSRGVIYGEPEGSVDNDLLYQ